MDNKKSSYYKLFRFALIIVVIVLMLIGTLLVGLCSSIFKRSKLNEIQSVGDMYITCISEEYQKYGEGYLQSAQHLQELFMGNYDVRIYVYNDTGACIISGDGPANAQTAPLSANMQKLLDEDDFLDMSAEMISKNKPSLIFGSKVYLKQNSMQYVPIYVIVYGSTDEINFFTMKIVALYLLFAIIGIFLCYLLLKRTIVKHIEFENQFLRISEKFSKGDFSEKIPTDLPGNLKDISECVNAIAANVEKSDATSRTFIANVSHELRTPITTIGGFVDGILDGTIPKPRQHEYLILVSKEIQRLRILISSMLNMTRFETGTMQPNFRETNLTDLVIQVVLMFEKKIEDKHLNVEDLDSGRLVAIVDADLMQQVIYNLVENAVKFVNEGGTLSFRFETHDDICIVGVRNTGEGLRDTEIQQVFDRFYKTDSSRGKDTTGLGLGLSISRKIVHLHHGHIVVKSVYGEYTEFQIQIPLDPRKKAEKKEKEKKEKQSS